jgi:hypothetical protein
MPTYAESATYRDSKGQTSVVNFFVTAADEDTARPLANTIVTAMSALTNAAFDGAKGAYTSSPATHAYGATAEYETVEDKAGAIHRYMIPAPKAAIMSADRETVDPANGLVVTFVAAMVAAGASRDGVAIDSFVGGIRIRRRFKRKFTIFTKNPALTGPGE